MKLLVLDFICKLVFIISILTAVYLISPILAIVSVLSYTGTLVIDQLIKRQEEKQLNTLIEQFTIKQQGGGSC